MDDLRALVGHADSPRAAICARLQVAEAAARESGRLLLDRLGHVREVTTKSSSMDLVTEVDVASGKSAVARILAAFPDDAVITEEPAILEGVAVAPASRAEYVWVIDPLDGTTSYVHTFPYFSVSIALFEGGVPVAGVVYAPIDDECFTGIAGEGSWLDGRPLATSRRSSIEEALLITGFSYDRSWPLERQIRILYAFLKHVHGIRRSGSAALDLCYVAAGRADGYWELEMKDWDLAAGAVILRGAGGKLTGFGGSDWVPGVVDVIASNSAMHDELARIVGEADLGSTPRDLAPLV